MAEPFKNNLGPDAVRRLADHLVSARPGWDPAPFLAAATEGLQDLELKARVAHVAAALKAHLAPDYEDALAHLLDAIPPREDGGTGDLTSSWEVWPVLRFVGEYGVQDPERSLPALARLTGRWSAEFAIRPYLRAHPERTMAALRAWAESEDPHVRRLVSEGTRPRLPWGGRLRAFQADPSPTLALLERLKDDPEEYVRRSVANHLNDIGKDHPERLVETARRWWDEGAGGERRRLVRHALRSLVKAGHPGALEVLGYGPPRLHAPELTVLTERVVLGGALRFVFVARSRSDAPQPLVIDYAVHHRKADGSTSPKVFKWSTRTLQPGEALRLERSHPMQPVSTRRYYAGGHAVEVQVNGRRLGRADFRLDLE